MNIVYCRNYDLMSREAAARIAAGVRAKKDLRVCAATGASPAGLYRELAHQSQLEAGLFDQLCVVKLDEWYGVPHADPVTCEYFLQERLLAPLAITAERYISFNSIAPDPDQECRRIRHELDRAGGIDICILGLGMNGHIGFNEPATALEPWCHVARLSAATLAHPMLHQAPSKPTHGMTLGIGDILAARKVLLLISGRGKEPMIESFLRGRVTTELPATFTLLHPKLEIFIDKGRS